MKVGLLICYDIEFPEASRMFALAGAELIAVPTALMEPYCRTTRIIIPARAYENQLFVAYVNRCGAEADLTYCGLRCVVGPDGEDLVKAGRTEGLFFADIDVSAIAAAKGENPYRTDLRPDLYATKVRKGEKFRFDSRIGFLNVSGNQIIASFQNSPDIGVRSLSFCSNAFLLFSITKNFLPI